MRYVSLPEVLEIHRRVLSQSGGAEGIRDLGAIESESLIQGWGLFSSRCCFANLRTKISRLSALSRLIIKRPLR